MLIFYFILLICGCLCLLGFIHWFYKTRRNNRLSAHLIYLNSGDEYETWWLQLGHWFIEKVIFLRIDLFKNNPRGNFLWLKTIIHFTIIYCLIFIAYIYIFDESTLKEQFKEGRNYFLILGSYLTLINTFYWAEKTKLKDKWQYLATLYNQTLNVRDDESKHLILSNALAIDIVTTMMWGHRSFTEIVKTELEEAISNLDDQIRKDIIANKFDNHQLKEFEAIKLLEDYQKVLFSKYPRKKAT